jgi:F-type H+-transporting ATPase subunit alpha
LARGERVVEVLKQGQYAPLSVEDQVMVIFAVTQGYLDDLAASEIRAWESSFREYMRSGHPGVGDAIRTENVISDDTEEKLRKAIEAHKKLFRTAAAEETPAEAAG